MIEFFIIIGLLLLNGFFSMAEIALVSSRKARLETQANKGDAKAKAALALANKPDTFLSTVQVGITLVGILTSIYSGEAMKGGLTNFFNSIPIVAKYSSMLATTAVVVIITYLTLIIGELVPKRIGLSNPEKIAKNAAAPMRFLTLVTFPFIWLLSTTTNFIVKIFNIKTSDNQVTEEEIKAIINEGTEHGALEEAEQEIIERVFDLGDRNITSLMTHRSDIVWLNIDATVADVKALATEMVHSIYPICNKTIDQIKGVVSLKEIFKKDANTLLTDIMIPAVFVPENNTAYQVLQRFKDTQIHHAFIVDEYGSMEGLITLNDILEAIVGDIPQKDEDDYSIIQRADGSYLVDAQIPFYDFLSYFDKSEWIDENEGEYDTLAGFLIHHLKRIPVTTDTHFWKEIRFEIMDMDGHRIDKILVTVPEELVPEQVED